MSSNETRVGLRVGLLAVGLLVAGGCETESDVQMTGPSSMVGGSLAGVDPTLDSDGDGVTDVSEGTGDQDLDGIPDNLDSDTVAGPPGGGTGGVTAGSAGTTGTSGMAGTTGPGTDDGGVEPPPMVCDKGVTQGSSVLLMGDSYVAINNKAFGQELMRLAQADGSLAAGDAYADRSVSGTSLSPSGLSSFLPAIPTQYTGAGNDDGHIKTVVMDGGGNDVLLGNRSCIDNEAPPGNDGCAATINKAMDVMENLLAQMASDGVEQVVYFFYPNLPGGGLGGDKAISNQTLDWAIDRTDGRSVRTVCEEAPLRCHFVDTRGLFPAETSEFQDGIHPTVDNIQVIAQHVWGAMKQQCIAQ